MQIVARRAKLNDIAVGAAVLERQRRRAGQRQRYAGPTHPTAEVEDAPIGQRAAVALDQAQALALLALLPDPALAPARKVGAPGHMRQPMVDPCDQLGFALWINCGRRYSCVGHGFLTKLARSSVCCHKGLSVI